MKNLTSFVKDAESKALEIQDGSVNKISKEDLEKYLDVAKKFLDEDGKNIVGWLIDNPDYVSKLAREDADNALAAFYNRGLPKDASLKPLYKWLKSVVKNNRIMEVPVFQTKEQFEGILNKKVSPDEIILDFSTEAGRNAIAKKYDPLVWKVARDFTGKSEFSLDDLHAIGAAGLVDAMNTYGKKTSKSSASDEEVKGYTFLSWASYRIRIWILENIKDLGHMVRIPRSRQSKERAEKGYNTKSNSISIETPVGADKDGNTKTLIDKIGDYERAGKNLEAEDADKMWSDIDKKLKEKFDKDTLDIFYSWWGLFGHKKLSGKELMQKYGFKNQSNINAVCAKVINYMKKDPKMFEMLKELYEFTNECRHDDDMEDRDNEPVYLSQTNKYDEDEF